MCYFERMLAKEIKRGMIVNYSCAPCIIETIAVQSPSARGAATYYKYRARNLISKQKVDITLKGGESLDEADFEKRPVKFMYSDGSYLHFLDQTDFNQHSLPAADLQEQASYLNEELEGVTALFYNNECVGIDIPQTVVLKIAECDPYVKGNSATGRTKPAKLETGLMIHVPEYLAQGELVKVDTRTGEFLSRA
ncbi:MAG TPA: elongation factor P [Pirellulales bacterium]|nr:elongation factor P [Pirellulales bacterium]